MAKSRKLDDALALLRQTHADPTTPASIAILRQILSGKLSVAIAQAAKQVATAGLTALIPDLVAAFDTLMVSPADRDPGCLGKTAIADALYRLEYRDEQLFLAGVHHIQMEPVWGGQEDKAGALRGACALGLVRMNYERMMVELADLLADPLMEVRIAAARAIAYSNDPSGIPLLRLRVNVGDVPAVVSECFVALLQLDAAGSLPLVQSFLQPPTRAGDATPPSMALAEAAAMAIAEARLPEALTILQTWWRQVRAPDLRQSGLLAIALLRQDAAIDFLVSLIAEGSYQDAKDAVQALSLYRSDQALWHRVGQASEARPEPNFNPDALLKSR